MYARILQGLPNPFGCRFVARACFDTMKYLQAATEEVAKMAARFYRLVLASPVWLRLYLTWLGLLCLRPPPGGVLCFTERALPSPPSHSNSLLFT